MQPKQIKFAALFVVALAVSGCAGSTATDAGPPFCLAAAPISASSRDTEDTRLQIDAHNAVGLEFCGW